MRLRRRLLLVSTPVAAAILVCAVKMVSVVLIGGSTVTHFADRDAGALRADAAALGAFNVIQPGKAPFAAGSAAVLDNRLDEADRQFSAALAATDHDDSCPARVDLELVRETLGDRAAARSDGAGAVALYTAARTMAEQAPSGCFAGNTDPDTRRQAVRNDTLGRLDAKIAAARAVPPPPPPDAAAVPSAVPPPGAGEAPDVTDTRLRLDPEAGDPLERLQQILRDAAALP